MVSLPGADHLDLQEAAAALPILPVSQAGVVVDGYRLDTILSDGRYSRVFRASTKRRRAR